MATTNNTTTTVIQQPKNGMGVAALVIGVVALVLAILVVFFPLAGLLGLIAVILGAIGMARASRGEATNRGQALSGLVTGLIALILAILVGVGIGTFAFGHINDFRKLSSCWHKANTVVQRRACARIFSNHIGH